MSVAMADHHKALTEFFSAAQSFDFFRAETQQLRASAFLDIALDNFMLACKMNADARG